MTTLITTVFIASLLGSLHCAGMCGGVVALCVSVEGPETETSPEFAPASETAPVGAGD